MPMISGSLLIDGILIVVDFAFLRRNHGEHEEHTVYIQSYTCAR